MLLTSLHISKNELESGTGWQLKPEGACKGDVCIPLSAESCTGSDVVDVQKIAKDLGMPLVGEPEHNLWSLGPESIGSRALTTAVAPEVSLPDLDGKLFPLSSLKGQKIIVYAWAPY